MAEEIKMEWGFVGGTYGVKMVETLQAIEGALKDPSALMKEIGILLLIQAQRSFKDQGLGDIRWKPRYPNQKPPVINIAGSLQDLNKGTTPKAHRFQRRPALMDTDALYMSVARDASGANRLMGTHVVQVGSVLPYAGTMQWGGKSSQPVTDTAKKTLAKWMKSLRSSRRETATYNRKENEWVPSGTAEKSKKKTGKKTTRSGTPKKSQKGTPKKSKMPKTSGMGKGQEKLFKQQSNEINRASKLGFLFKKDKLTTRIWPRPFLGMTTQVDKDIRELIQDWVANYVNR